MNLNDILNVICLNIKVKYACSFSLVACVIKLNSEAY